jgi:hypothetical protein
VDQPATKKSHTPTVSRVIGDTLVELVLNPSTNETALVVSRFDGLWNIEKEVTIGKETLVPYSARNNLIAHRCVLLPSELADHGTKEELLADIQAFLHRYVDLTPAFERIATYYVLLSWLHDAFAEVPYLRLRGDFGTGKTRGLIAIGSLCYKPFFAAGASTVSPIFHTLDRFGGTLVLDEADFRFSDATADLVKIFNNGTVKGLPVLRSIQNREKEFNPVAFNVFGPKIIAMRGSFDDEALESRFITEETGGRSLRSDIPINVPARLHDEALLLRNRLLHFRISTFFKTEPASDRTSADLDPRLNQIGLPLLTLADNADDQAIIRDALLRQQRETREQKAQTLEGLVLSALIDAVALEPDKPVSVQAVTDRTNITLERAGQPLLQPRRVGAILRNRLQLIARKSNGVYVIEINRDRLTNLAKRYGVDVPVP